MDANPWIYPHFYIAVFGTKALCIPISTTNVFIPSLASHIVLPHPKTTQSPTQNRRLYLTFHPHEDPNSKFISSIRNQCDASLLEYVIFFFFRYQFFLEDWIKLAGNADCPDANGVTLLMNACGKANINAVEVR
jgi:hypothetical protein